MKHVREDLPDVQRRRPEVSRRARRDPRPHDRQGPRAALPGRARPAGRPRGGARARAARTGALDRRGDRRPAHAARERPPPRAAAHAPPAADRRRRGADRRRRRAGRDPRSSEGIDRTQRGTGPGHRQAAGRQPRASRSSAPRPHAFDPLGDDEEHNARSRSWSTTTAARTGAPRPTRAATSARTASASTSTPTRASPPRSIEIETPDPGWTAEIRVADGEQAAEGHRRLEEGRRRRGQPQAQALQARHGDRHRYYLVWITELAPRRRARRDHRDRAVRARGASLEGVAAALGAEALERELHEPVAQLRERDARRLPQLRVDARLA